MHEHITISDGERRPIVSFPWRGVGDYRLSSPVCLPPAIQQAVCVYLGVDPQAPLAWATAAGGPHTAQVSEHVFQCQTLLTLQVGVRLGPRVISFDYSNRAAAHHLCWQRYTYYTRSR